MARAKAIQKSEFLEILKTFPGRKELEEGVPNREKFARYDFVELAERLKKARWKVELKKDEELWLKMLTFLDIVNWHLAHEIDVKALSLDDLVYQKTMRTFLDKITEKFNNFLEKSNKNAGICLTPEGMLMKELSVFVKEGKHLFD